MLVTAPTIRSNNRQGFSLIEMMIALALMSALIVSLGAALNAALNANTENTKLSEASQTGRAILNRICQDIRTASAVTTTATSITILPPDNDDDLTQIEYELDAGKLYLRRTVDGTETSYVLLGDTNDNVTVATFTITSQAGVDYEDVACTATVNIDLKLDYDGNQFSLTASASPRQNQLF